jgi:hypothetical protein
MIRTERLLVCFGLLSRFRGEGVSQSSLKDQAFSIFRDQNPPFELRLNNGVSPPIS